MKKELIKEEMLKAIGHEIDQWLEESEKIKSGYEYEDKFLVRAQRIIKILMQNSIGEAGTNRNKKKTSYLRRGIGSTQNTSDGSIKK